MFTAPDATADPVPPVVRIPTSEAQQELWTATQLGTSASLSFNEAVALTLDGPLHIAALEAAVAQVIARHEALRARCSSDGRFLEVQTHSSLPIARHDWRGLDVEAQHEALRAHELALVETPFDLTNGPLVRVALATLGETSHVLTIAAHHIICDGWSFGVIARELGALYSAECAARDAALPEPDRLDDYTALLHDEADTPEAEAAEAW
jgi:NRPS condensation-like uncharacterized protein